MAEWILFAAIVVCLLAAVSSKPKRSSTRTVDLTALLGRKKH